MSWPKDVITSGGELMPPADPVVIDQVLKQLGVRLPQDYLDFLHFADGGVLPGGTMIVYSAGPGIHPSETLLAANRDRPRDFPMLLVSRDAYEEYGFLKSELKQLEQGSRLCPVYRYRHENEEVEQVAPSFREFVEWAMQSYKPKS